MSPTLTPVEARFGEPLQDLARRERKTLLGVSMIAIAIAKTGLVPSEITNFGIKFTQTDQVRLFQILAWVVLYFLLAFLIEAVSDCLAWRIAIREADQEDARAHRTVVSPYPPPPPPPLATRVRRRLQGVGLRAAFLPRALFGVGVPLAVGLYALFALLTASPPPPKPVTPEQVRAVPATLG